MKLGIDLGTSTTIVYLNSGKGPDRIKELLNEPSVVAIDSRTGKVKAAGIKAKMMIGRTPSHIIPERPIRDGVISNFEAAEAMLKYFINKARRKLLLGRFIKPDIVICIPADYTTGEENALKEAALSCGARNVAVIEEPMAAAIGAGLPVDSPRGFLIVDIGGGTTDIAVISLGSIIVKKSIKVAGDKMDEAIKKYIKKEFNMVIGDQTAESIKINIGSVYPIPGEEELVMNVKGHDLVKGLPTEKVITAAHVREALHKPVKAIIDAIKEVLSKTPAELSADIIETGINVTGGGAKLRGLKELIEKEFNIQVNVPDEPEKCVARGTALALDVLGKETYLLD